MMFIILSELNLEILFHFFHLLYASNVVCFFGFCEMLFIVNQSFAFSISCGLFFFFFFVFSILYIQTPFINIVKIIQ